MKLQIKCYKIHEKRNNPEDITVSFENAKKLFDHNLCNNSVFVWEFEIENNQKVNETVRTRLPKQVYWEGHTGITDEMLDDDENLPAIPNQYPAPTLQELINEIEKITKDSVFYYCKNNLFKYPITADEAFEVYMKVKNLNE